MGSFMELKAEDYCIWYDAATQTVTCQGALRLGELEDYAPIAKLLEDVIDQTPSQLTLDLRELKFLNSSGFNVLSRFVLRMRQEKDMQMVIHATKMIPWHEKSLKNWQRLLPNLQIEFD